LQPVNLAGARRTPGPGVGDTVGGQAGAVAVQDEAVARPTAALAVHRVALERHGVDDLSPFCARLLSLPGGSQRAVLASRTTERFASHNNNKLTCEKGQPSHVSDG